MKKTGVILIILAIFILLVSLVSLVSAETNETESNETNGESNETETEECPSVIGWRIENNQCISESGCDYNSSKYDYYDDLEDKLQKQKKNKKSHKVSGKSVFRLKKIIKKDSGANQSSMNHNNPK